LLFKRAAPTETVINRKTGVFFKKQTVDSLMQAIEEFESLSWNRHTLRRHAEKFNSEVFAHRINEFLGKVMPATVALSKSSEMNAKSEFTVQRGAA
jgi:glycosyltransferase involved in cell wall biosynthesis